MASKLTPKKIGHAITRSKNWKKLFIEALRENGVVSYACNNVGIERQTAYQARKTDSKFSALWQEALESACDSLELEAVRRASKGVAEPVFYQGEQCGSIQRYSDTLLIFLLKANRPEKYRDTFKIEHHAGSLRTKAKEFGLTPESIEGNPILLAVFAALGISADSLAGNGEDRASQLAHGISQVSG